MLKLRCIGDKQTWIANIHTTGITILEKPDAVIESTTWGLDKPEVQDPFNTAGPFSNYDVQADNQICHPVLKHQ